MSERTVAQQAGPADPAARRALVQELADALGEAERGWSHPSAKSGYAPPSPRP